MTTIITMLAAAFLNLAAHADYVPGRVRVDAKGDLSAAAASGVFKGLNRAIVLQEVTDGKGITGYLLITPKGEVHFKAGKPRFTRCGQIFSALSDSERGLQLSLRDSGPTPSRSCRLPNEWTIEILKGDNSRLALEGEPRRYLVTEGGN
jgi:hypothetical protein